MTNTIEQFAKNTAELSVRIFAEFGAVVPMWVFVDDRGCQWCRVVPVIDENSKITEAIFVRTYVKAKRIVRCVNLAEAFIRGPERSEVIILNAEDKGGDHVFGSASIVRRP